MMEVIEHEHPLKLIDLQVNVEDVDDKSDDEEEKEEDLVPQDEFSCTCKRCDEDINEFYRYYYKCIHDSCDFALHKFCAELPETLKQATHPHPLTLRNAPDDWTCDSCQRDHKGGAFYECDDCWLWKDVNCVVEADKRRIYHPSHPHPLVSLRSKPILCECNACGKEHTGLFFLCTICLDFAIHIDCAFLPKRLLIQHATNAIFSHTHPLTLSYSFPKEEFRAKHNPRCRVCDGVFEYDWDLWIYKCEKCIYYAHLDCATSREESFMSILSIGGGPTVKNYKDADYPNLLHLPFPDETCSIPKHLFFKKLGPADYGNHEVSLRHMNHQHELILVDTAGSIGSTSSKINDMIVCHNPMEKIELLCSGCVRPIMEMPFYKCRAKEDENCNFALHEWCTRLPTKVHNHPGHPKHTLLLMTNIPNMFNIFRCYVCHLPCNGFAYGCVKCGFYVDVTCGFIPEKITHESHPNHLLSITEDQPPSGRCLMCRLDIDVSWLWSNRDKLSFSCRFCDVYIHPWCALFLPKTIRHPYDKHPMHISYLPIENHKSEYFCEICEEPLNPHKCFYHCDVCSQSVHSDCAPLILQSETETHSSHWDKGKGVYDFLNMKFGSIHKTDGHPHPLTFAQGIEGDGLCSVCAGRFRYQMILRCSECEFAVHHDCFEELNKS